MVDIDSILDSAVLWYLDTLRETQVINETPEPGMEGVDFSRDDVLDDLDASICEIWAHEGVKAALEHCRHVPSAMVVNGYGDWEDFAEDTANFVSWLVFRSEQDGTNVG